jgi:hypothetical protein
MKLDANKLGISLGGATALLWIICSTLVAVLPSPMMAITGHMLHANMQQLGWTLTLAGFIVGLVSWTICGTATGWLIAKIYNRLSESTAA